MKQYEKVLHIAKEHNGIITSETIDAHNISRGILKYAVDRNLLEKTGRGIYVLPDVWDDEFLSIQYQFSKGIFTSETVFYFANITDRTPSYFSMSFPQYYNVSNARKSNIKCSRLSLDYHEKDIVEYKTPYGNFVKGYILEKALCDAFKPRNEVDIQVRMDAIKRYVQKKERDLQLLSKFAKEMKVEKIIRGYLEVLL